MKHLRVFLLGLLGMALIFLAIVAPIVIADETQNRVYLLGLLPFGLLVTFEIGKSIALILELRK
jgi:hypothetical protein